eukprot:4441446-Amphidinium_carterae.1
MCSVRFRGKHGMQDIRGAHCQAHRVAPPYADCLRVKAMAKVISHIIASFQTRLLPNPAFVPKIPD